MDFRTTHHALPAFGLVPLLWRLMTRLIRSNQNGALDNGQQGMTQGDVRPLAARTTSFTALISSAKTFHLTVGDLGMAKISVPQRILDFNAGRDPERLALKLQACARMRSSFCAAPAIFSGSVFLVTKC